MGAPEKYERDFVERAVRMYRDRLAEGGDSKVGARRHVGSLLDLNPATRRNWVEDEERRHGVRPPTAAARAADSEDGKSSAVQDAVAAQSMSPRLVSLWPSRMEVWRSCLRTIGSTCGWSWWRPCRARTVALILGSSGASASGWVMPYTASRWAATWPSKTTPGCSAMRNETSVASAA
jgi:hypothetical protein